MILEKIQIKYSGGVPGGIGVPAKEFHAYRREAWLACAELWHAKFRPKHFTKAGAKEYGYQPRAGEGLSGKAYWRSYTGRKQRRLGQANPMVYSGKSRERTERKMFRAVSRGAKSACQIRIGAPTLSYRRQVGKKQTPDMDKEMTTVTDREFAALVYVHDQTMNRLLQQRPYEVTKTISAKA